MMTQESVVGKCNNEEDIITYIMTMVVIVCPLGSNDKKHVQRKKY